MANGIRKSQLTRDINGLGRWAEAGEVYEALVVATPSPMTINPPKDGRYWVMPMEPYQDMAQHFGVHQKPYRADRRDCDDFAQALNGLAGLDFGANGVGYAECFWRDPGTGEWAGHAFNCLAVLEHDRVKIRFFEPQSGREVELGPAPYAPEAGSISI